MEMVDLTAGSDEEDVSVGVEDSELHLAIVKRNAPSKAFVVRNAMERLIAPELLAMEPGYPGILDLWRKFGVDIVIAADGTGLERFSGYAIKMEIGGCKILTPGCFGDTSTQQAAFLGIPLFMYDGEEGYSALKATFARMFSKRHLADHVTIAINNDQPIEIEVRWHLCADLKLMCIVGGLSGASSRRPCFWCTWNRGDPTVPGEPRSAAAIGHQAAWATELLLPIRRAEAALTQARAKVKASRKDLTEATTMGRGKSKQV
jgi:hypothetical protein